MTLAAVATLRVPRIVDPMRTRLVIGVLLCVVGGVWFGQGVGAIGGSFMTGEEMWAAIGAVALLFGVALIRGAIRERRDKT